MTTAVILFLVVAGLLFLTAVVFFAVDIIVEKNKKLELELEAEAAEKATACSNAEE